MTKIPEHIWFLFSRNLAGEATEQEREELAQLLRQDSQLQSQYDMMKQLWNSHGQGPIEKAEPSKINRILQLSALEKVLTTPQQPVETPVANISRSRHVVRYAAIIVLLLASAWILKTVLFNKQNADDEIVAKKGSRTRSILPDGSTVWLNAGSRISFLPGFNQKTREVALYGEAYFDVIKQPDRPFIVHAGGVRIRVLGTAFNVKSYPGDRAVETTLIRGLVQILQSNNQSPILLRPHQKAILPVQTAGSSQPGSLLNGNSEKKELSTVSKVSDLDTTLKEDEFIETAWVYNRLQFRGDSFQELAKKLERWYNINIHFQDENVKDLMFNGSIENETVQQAFHALQTAVPFDYKIDGNEIFIKTYEETSP